jgi:serine/threonine protein kinase
MGAVYLAEDTKLNRKVALKFLPTEMLADPERLKRFEREAKTVAALNHPNIVTIYAVEEEGGVPFIVMELVDGKSLTELIPAEGQKLERIFELAIPIADAVSAAHDRGITHRDLKPGNIMVGNDGRVKVLDFGLAKLMEDPQDPAATSLSTQTLTKTGSALGTVTYMAPEQLKGKPPDQRADIFSLGIVLYQMASGQRPFHGETSAEVISSILRDAPPPVTDLKIDLPSHLGRIVKRCLEKNPNRRYQTAAELRNELEELKSEVESGTVFEEDARTKAIKVPNEPGKTKRLAGVIGGGIAFVAMAALLWSWFGRASDSSPDAGLDEATRTLAVLPFSDLGAAGDSAFTLGLNEEIASLLTDLPNIQVVSRATARQQFQSNASTREIGEALGADYLVLGSVRWSGGDDEATMARATLEVIRVEDDIQVWSESFDRELLDELTVQTEIARQAVRGVGTAVLDLDESMLPPEPEPIEIAESPETVREPSRQTVGREPPPRRQVATTNPPAEQIAEARSSVVKIADEPDSKTAEEIASSDAELRIEFTTFEPEGVLTIYADNQQVLSESFTFEERKKGPFGRKRVAGSLSARQAVPAATQTLRIYLLVGNETKLVTLETDLKDTTGHELQVELTRKGELLASLR